MIRIICDTREQKPFHFSPAVEVIRAALPVGDYSLAGLEEEIAIERKSLPDLLQSITRERERFTRELRQLRAYRLAVLMIESNWEAIQSGLYGFPSQVRPSSVIGSLMSFALKYRVVPILASDHATGAILTERILTLYAAGIQRDYQKVFQAL
jgi:DNA excision repair protein ERCC-4